MAKPMIEIEVGEEESIKGMGEKLTGDIGMAKQEEDDGYMSLLDGVNVSPKALIGLTNALNKVLPLFGLPPIKEKALTPEVVRALSMIAQAVTDAVGMDEVPAELEYSLDEMKGGDGSVIIIAGKLDRLSKIPAFKKFLKSKPTETPSNQEPMGDPMAMEKTAEQSPNIEALFASRM
jgi:hypothetical protein